MADKDLQMDVAPEEEKSSKGMLVVIIIVVVVLLIGAGVAAFFLLGGEKDNSASAEPGEERQAVAVYKPMRPSFVVNFANAAGKTRFLQLEVTLMGRDADFMEGLDDHLPLIKSRLVDVFQTQEFEELRTQEGKEAMRDMALEELQTLFTEELGDPGIEKVYFTVFVLQ